MDFYAVGDWAREYVFVFAGGGYGWGGAAGVDCTFVLWGEGVGRREEFTQRAQRKSTEITEKKNAGEGKTAPLKAKGAAPGGEEKNKTPGAKPAPGAPEVVERFCLG
jgi:hypothetical protein